MKPRATSLDPRRSMSSRTTTWTQKTASNPRACPFWMALFKRIKRMWILRRLTPHAPAWPCRRVADCTPHHRTWVRQSLHLPGQTFPPPSPAWWGSAALYLSTGTGMLGLGVKKMASLWLALFTSQPGNTCGSSFRTRAASCSACATWLLFNPWWFRATWAVSSLPLRSATASAALSPACWSVASTSAACWWSSSSHTLVAEVRGRAG